MHRLPLFCAAAMACLLGGATLCVPVQAAEEHFYTLIAADKTSATFAEDSARRFRDGTIRLNVLRVFDGGAIAYSNTQMMLTCATSKAQTLEGMTYSRDGKKIATPAEAEATAIKPETLGMVLKRYICEGIDPYPRSKTLKSLDDALERGPELIAVEKAQ
jgi:hypothetical protein